jgi:hypothetical protein
VLVLVLLELVLDDVLLLVEDELGTLLVVVSVDVVDVLLEPVLVVGGAGHGAGARCARASSSRRRGAPRRPRRHRR